MKYNDNGNDVEIIKPKSKKEKVREEKIKESFQNNKGLISPILMGIIGIIFLTNSDGVIIFGFYIIGALIAGFGCYNIIRYIQIKNQLKIEDSKSLTTGIILCTIGLLIILLSGIIQTFINLIVGVWLITSGITKLISSNKSDTKTKNFYLVEAVIYISMGLYSIFFQNIILTLIGIWMIVASVLEIYNTLKK